MRRAKKIARFNPETDSMYYIEGTPSHVMNGAISEEIIARALEATPRIPPTKKNDYEDGRFTWPQLRATVNDVLFDVAHTGPAPGSRAWLYGNTMRLTTV